MDYNTSRGPLKIPEYGRYLQNYVQYIKILPTREERTQAALSLMQTMAILNPQPKDNPEYRRKIWDQLIILADYDLDVEPVFPFPNKEERDKKPESVPYTSATFQKRHYGKFVEEMAKKIKDYNTEEQETLILLLANTMKKSYLVWNKNSVDDITILVDLQELAGPEVQIPLTLTLSNVKDVANKIKQTQNQNNKLKQKKKNKKR